MARPGFAPRADVAARRARVLARRIEQIPYAQIAADEGISESTARSDYQRAFEALKHDLSITVAEARLLELGRLAAMERETWRVLRTRHITIQQGKIVRDEGGQVVEDDAPVLQAVDRLERISRRRAALLGLDAPVKVEVDDARRAEIQRLAGELAAAGLGELEPEGAGAAPGDAAAGEDSPGAP